MKLGIVGNCQVRGLLDCLVRLAPDHQFESIQVEQLESTDQVTLARIVDLAASVDVLFAHSPESSVTRQGPQQALEKALAESRPQRVVTIPRLLYLGFHPDCCVIDCNGVYLDTVAYQYHSAIVAGAYLCGLPARRVPSLFNRFVYAGLGYLGDLEMHHQQLRLRFSQLGFDADPILASKKVFMFCPNHPVITGLFELASQMLLRVGITPASATPPEDWMEKYALHWPIYPGLFDSAMAPNASLDLLHGSRVISLNALIESSFACYADHHLSPANCNAPSAAHAARFLGTHVQH